MTKRSYTIGRAGDVTLYDDTVSRRHACLEIDGDSLFLRDLDSRNGTYEIRDQELIPFEAGPVRADQVFAFGECVRSVTQLLKVVEPEHALSSTAGGVTAEVDENPLDATQVSFSIAPRKRLNSANVIEMLEQVEDDTAAGRELQVVCRDVGITVQRYERWCREYGATRREREQTIVAMRRENDRLRKLVADLSLERDALKDALRSANDDGKNKPGDSPSPSLTIVTRKP